LHVFTVDCLSIVGCLNPLLKEIKVSVFMQVEKNPLIGTQYWLSPIKIFPERVRKLAELREQYKSQLL
jgi:hypothetical protein